MCVRHVFRMVAYMELDVSPGDLFLEMCRISYPRHLATACHQTAVMPCHACRGPSPATRPAPIHHDPRNISLRLLVAWSQGTRHMFNIGFYCREAVYAVCIFLSIYVYMYIHLGIISAAGGGAWRKSWSSRWWNTLLECPPEFSNHRM